MSATLWNCSFLCNTSFDSFQVIFGEGNGTPLQYSCLENPMDRGAWWAAVHRVTMSWTRLSNFTFTFHFYALGKEMATCSSVLAWRVPGTGEPGGLPSVGSHRVGHDGSDLAVVFPTLFAEETIWNTKQKQAHWHREQTSGCQRRGGRETGEIGEGD